MSPVLVNFIRVCARAAAVSAQAARRGREEAVAGDAARAPAERVPQRHGVHPRRVPRRAPARVRLLLLTAHLCSLARYSHFCIAAAVFGFLLGQ